MCVLQEDRKLAKLIGERGPKYTEIAADLPGRTGKQCRNRWLMTLDPGLLRDPFSDQEYRAILLGKQRLGEGRNGIL